MEPTKNIRFGSGVATFGGKDTTRVQIFWPCIYRYGHGFVLEADIRMRIQREPSWWCAAIRIFGFGAGIVWVR